MSEWRSIDTAPKSENARILLYAAGYDPVIGRWWGSGWGHSDEDSDIPYGSMDDPRWTPTHWMPLPEPPQ
jgi:hypothetical protein